MRVYGGGAAFNPMGIQCNGALNLLLVADGKRKGIFAVQVCFDLMTPAPTHAHPYVRPAPWRCGYVSSGAPVWHVALRHWAVRRGGLGVPWNGLSV